MSDTVPTPGDAARYAFIVPIHPYLIAMCPGKRPGTVLTVERQIETVRVCEYTEPLFYKRFWCYNHEAEAITALANYIVGSIVDEPQGWRRAGEWGEHGTKIRRPGQEVKDAADY